LFDGFDIGGPRFNNRKSFDGVVSVISGPIFVGGLSFICKCSIDVRFSFNNRFSCHKGLEFHRDKLTEVSH
jgi:hypothetical protein